MLTRWFETPGFFPSLTYDLLRTLEEDFPLASQVWGPSMVRGWPRTWLDEEDDKLVIFAEVPGLTEKDLEITYQADTVTLRGQRNVQPPQGYRLHQQERLPMRFVRTFRLGQRVDANKAEARLENGVLTITLPKHPEEHPRQISVKSA